MNYNYKIFLLEKLTELQRELNISNFSFTIEEEQDFIKRKDYNPNTIYIVIKYLTDSKQVGASIQPVQLLVLSEQDSLEIAKTLFNRFSDNNNWKTYIESYVDDDNVSHNIYIKQQYSQPAVLSNFNPVLYGYRSVMYISATLFIMDDYVDIKNLKIDGISIEPINFSFQYTMGPNTQQKSSNNLSTSEKSTSSVSFALSIPPIYNILIKKIRNIVKGITTGNETFNISFDLKVGEETLDASEMYFSAKLSSAVLNTAPNQVPTWQIGFVL